MEIQENVIMEESVESTPIQDEAVISTNDGDSDDKIDVNKHPFFNVIESHAKEFERFGQQLSLNLKDSYKEFLIQQKEISKASKEQTDSDKIEKAFKEYEEKIVSQSQTIDSLKARIEELETDSIIKDQDIKKLQHEFNEFKKEIKSVLTIPAQDNKKTASSAKEFHEFEVQSPTQDEPFTYNGIDHVDKFNYDEEYLSDPQYDHDEKHLSNQHVLYETEDYDDKFIYNEKIYNEEIYSEKIYNEEIYSEKIYNEEIYNEEIYSEEIYNEEYLPNQQTEKPLSNQQYENINYGNYYYGIPPISIPSTSYATYYGGIPPPLPKLNDNNNSNNSNNSIPPTIATEMGRKIHTKVQSAIKARNGKVNENTFKSIRGFFNIKQLVEYEDSDLFKGLSDGAKKFFKAEVTKGVRKQLSSIKPVSLPTNAFVRRELVPPLPYGVKNYAEFQKTAQFTLLPDDVKRGVRKLASRKK